jgi:serine/threonine protein phosphatase PrpC
MYGSSFGLISHISGQKSYTANFPCEDRNVLLGFGELRGGAIFDGHGGWKISDFLAKYIHPTLMKYYMEYREEKQAGDRMTKTLESTFNELERLIINRLLPPYEIDDNELSFSGSCGIVALIQGSKLVVANAGDSQAVLVSEIDGSAKAENICDIHNTTIASERIKLKEKFTDDKTIIMTNRSSTAMYVKGRLMCTRSFGDLALKHDDFNINSKKFGLIENWAGPYITHTPNIVTKELTADMRFLVMGSDGLWDEIEIGEAATIVL